MSAPEHDKRLDYVEFLATDLEAIKAFYGSVFGWKFTDYGPSYVSFEDGRMTGGFALAESVPSSSILIVIYALDLEAVQAAIEAAGGAITRPTFSFPGGRRFHFNDPSGNGLAVWSDRAPGA